MLTQNMTEFAATIKAHAAADLIEKGKYYDEKTGRGCFIGCLAHGNDIGLIATKYGLPMPLTRLLEHVFERLDADNARAFFAAIPDAIGGDGRDLGRVHWAFLGDTLRHVPPQPLITDVLRLYPLASARQQLLILHLKHSCACSALAQGLHQQLLQAIYRSIAA